jgi:hypothetical protein
LIAVEGGSLFRFRAWLRLVSVTLGEEGKEGAIVSFHIVIEQLDQHLAKLGIRMGGEMFEGEGTGDDLAARVVSSLRSFLCSIALSAAILFCSWARLCSSSSIRCARGFRGMRGQVLSELANQTDLILY